VVTATTTAVLDELAAAAGAARAATGDDAVGGVAPAVVASPTTTGAVAAAVRVCARRDLAVVARGHGTKLTWGAPPERLDVVLDLSGLAGVVEHEAGDLVATVRAGTGLDALAAALAPAGQRLAADPVVSPSAAGPGTLGGLIATAATGPRRLSAGAVRDLLIGATVVRADGEVARAGGKVVKNVAGYDLCKLLAGSWGTLAVITEATVRLHPVAPAAAWVRLPVTTGTLPGLAATLAASQSAPVAVEADLGTDGSGEVAVLVEGGPAGVAGRASALASLGAGSGVDDAAPPWWGRPPWPDGGTALRLTFALSGLDGLLRALAGTGLAWQVRGSVAAGVVHAGLAATADPDDVVAAVTGLRAARSAWAGDVVVLDAPGPVRGAVDLWGPAGGLELMRRVKATFDPGRRLAPGRFVGGI
jgi:glycolate oxidase FAD binding subunit